MVFNATFNTISNTYFSLFYVYCYNIHKFQIILNWKKHNKNTVVKKMVDRGFELFNLSTLLVLKNKRGVRSCSTEEIATPVSL
jgi:hypothetical protein